MTEAPPLAPVDEAIARANAASEESFIASSGPGGQNVNKVATAVQLRVDVFALRLQPQVFHRLKALAGSKMTTGGEIVLTARTHRTQDANRTNARERLEALLRDAHTMPAKRKKSRINRIGKVKRLKSKKARGQVKVSRGKPDW